MGLENLFPGTCLHELNLDWFLNQFKELVAEWNSTKAEWEQIQVDWQSMQDNFTNLNNSFNALSLSVDQRIQGLKDYIDNYFATELQPVVNNKIDELVQDGTIAALLTQVASGLSNPNLLDNPFFTVNQRGQSTYTTSGYTVDRWKLANNVSEITVLSNGLKGELITQDNLPVSLAQNLDDSISKYLSGKTVTLSVNVSNLVKTSTTSVACQVFIFGKVDGTARNLGALYIVSNGITTKTISIPTGVITELRVVIYFADGRYGSIVGDGFICNSIKLEVSPVSTLAADIAPNYGIELVKCQRYCQVINSVKRTYNDIAMGMVLTETSARILYPYRVNMRAIPVMTLSNASDFSINDANSIKDVTAITLEASSLENCYLTVTSSGLTPGHCVAFYSTNAGQIVLSADL